MKNNTEQTKAHLAAALNSLPSDFALQEVRGLLINALNRIEHVEEKRSRRAASYTNVPSYHMPRYDLTAKECRQAILGLDRMIREEKKKIDQSEKNGNQEPPKDLSTILG